LTLAISAGRASVTRSAAAATPLNELRAILPAMEIKAPSEAEIAYVLARFVKNLRSLSVDPVVVRANWMDALDYVTAREARTLDAYAREASPFAKIGQQAVTVEVTGVVRASADSFAIRWKEQTVTAAGIQTDRFTGVVDLVFKSPHTTGTISRNPLGIYVNGFKWSRDSIGDAAK
jgi:type IV secretory pathway TrbF-like protein